MWSSCSPGVDIVKNCTINCLSLRCFWSWMKQVFLSATDLMSCKEENFLWLELTEPFLYCYFISKTRRFQIWTAHSQDNQWCKWSRPSEAYIIKLRRTHRAAHGGSKCRAPGHGGWIQSFSEKLGKELPCSAGKAQKRTGTVVSARQFWLRDVKELPTVKVKAIADFKPTFLKLYAFRFSY